MDITSDMWITIAILVAAIILFVTEWVRVDAVALGVVISLMLTGILETSEALAGFSNSAVITIAALFIVGGAVLQTGLAGMIGRRILKVAGTDETRLIVVVMATVAILSGVMSDTGTVAVLLPAIIGLAQSAKISPSKLLIPLSFGSLLGGATTLIGTPPNIIVSDLLAEEGLARFEFFDYTPVGLLMLIAGIAFMVTAGKCLLPDYGEKEEIEHTEHPEELIDLYSLAEKVSYLRVLSKSKLRDKSLASAHLRSDFKLTVVEILRSGDTRPVATFGEQQLILQQSIPEHIFPTAETIIRVDDVLVVQAELENIEKAVESCLLEIRDNPDTDTESLVNRHRGVAEVVLPPRSSLIGKSLQETRFARSYNLSVLEINRPGSSKQIDTHNTRLAFGDILLVQGVWHDIMALRKRKRDFVLLGQPEIMIDTTNRKKAPIASIILFGMLIVLILNIIPLVTTALLAAMMVVMTGCLTMDEAYDSINWKSIVLIAGMLPMATALQSVGLVDEIANQVTTGFGEADPIVVMAGLFLLTSGFTQVLSNTATAVLVAPIALATAANLEVSPHAFMMTVAIAASMAFASPVASPVNTLVLGAGHYKFSDYIKVGLPMIVIMFVITMVAVPIFFPF
jgi:di/tricarboxylate transporter